MTRQTIGVVGAGTMGSGIAQLAAQKGFKVSLYDLNDALVNKGLNRIASSLAKLVDKGKLAEQDREETLARIQITSDVRDLQNVTVVIEAIVEDMQIKQDMFRKLDEILEPGVIIATNTSSLSITQLAEATARQDCVAGMHFFNPAPVMRLVEVVRGLKSSDETVSALMNLARELGKEPIEVKKDSPGFIVNRIMIPQFIEAIRLVEEGVATPEDIDKAVTLGLNYPMGPFALQDFAGVDIGLFVMDYFYDEFKDPRFAAPLSLRRLIRAGRTGRKAGAGWYDYDK
ncbi:3-hydroxyacyl-CoA dehydrogenase family protein [Cohnella sp. AR92]|uniref:3-hydroxyacyl-CoA dehydrogenase family protein n=1 Tax=Cohnella sp. AR92 TaxID=648716 RepID=UPI000F8C8659|nr:3-hydroxybutyryl-CoA dehydrogenase [Cohnella sp. AR92]RUS45727.1 3-hydroxybutyryl-CoA dehydrogenase [Cohnella sp. AR92]